MLQRKISTTKRKEKRQKKRIKEITNGEEKAKVREKKRTRKNRTRR